MIDMKSEREIYDENNGIWYELQGDYYIPCLTLPAEKESKPIGLWGQRHKRYLQEHIRAVYNTLLTSGRKKSLPLLLKKLLTCKCIVYIMCLYKHHTKGGRIFEDCNI